MLHSSRVAEVQVFELNSFTNLEISHTIGLGKDKWIAVD